MSARNIKEQTIFQPVITKVIDDNEQLVEELLRSTLIGLVNGFCLPLGVREGELMLKKLQGVDLKNIWTDLDSLQQKEMIEKIAQLLVNTKNNYQSKGRHLVNKYCSVMSFGEFVAAAQSFMDSDAFLGLDFDVNTLRAKIKGIDSSPNNLTLVHGDLGLSNIMLVGSELIFVDFEHLMEGPLELELSISNFWNDDNALPMNQVIESMKLLGEMVDRQMITQMTHLYFVNQLRLAVRDEDQIKINQLINKARERKLV